MLKSISFHLDGSIDNAKGRIEIAKHMIAKGYKVSFVCDHQRAVELLHEKGFQDTYNLAKYDDTNLSEEEQKNLLSYFNILGIKDIRKIYFTEYQLYHHVFPKPDIYFPLLTLKRLKALKELLESDMNASYYFDFAGDEIFHCLFRILANIKGGQIILYRATALHTRLALFQDDGYGVWRLPQDYLNNFKEPNKEELEYIDTFLNNNFKSKKVIWGNPKDRDFKLDLITKIKNLKINDLFSYKKYKTFKNGLKIIWNRNVNKLIYKHVKDLDNKVFYYFPMHYSRDSQLTLRGKPFVNQVAFIEMLSLYIPYGKYLVVKEHPHARGYMNYAELKRITSLPNVILLDPWENSHDFSFKAEAVLIINSTVGLESLFHNVPVVSFGKNYLNGSGLQLEIDEFFKLEYAFDNCKYIRPKEEDLINYLVATYRNSLPYDPIAFIQNRMSSEDLESFACDLDTYIQKEASL